MMVVQVYDGYYVPLFFMLQPYHTPLSFFTHPSLFTPPRRHKDTVEVAQSIYSNIASITSTSAPFEIKVL